VAEVVEAALLAVALACGGRRVSSRRGEPRPCASSLAAGVALSMATAMFSAKPMPTTRWWRACRRSRISATASCAVTTLPCSKVCSASAGAPDPGHRPSSRAMLRQCARCASGRCGLALAVRKSAQESLLSVGPITARRHRRPRRAWAAEDHADGHREHGQPDSASVAGHRQQGGRSMALRDSLTAQPREGRARRGPQGCTLAHDEVRGHPVHCGELVARCGPYDISALAIASATRSHSLRRWREASAWSTGAPLAGSISWLKRLPSRSKKMR